MLDVPHLRQLRSWSCGPACVRMVLRYFGQDASESDLIEELDCDGRNGTSPERLVQYLRRMGFSVRAGILSLQDLQLSASRSRPSIVAYQDWARPRVDYATSWDHGHYAIVVGADDRRIMLCDPSSKRPRRYLKPDDFLSRWHDIESDGTIYRQWGLSVGPKR